MAPRCFAALISGESRVAVAINASGTELFPTAMRATVQSWMTGAGIVGSVLGFVFVGAMSERVGGADAAICALALIFPRFCRCFFSCCPREGAWI